jgi:hypothetical protein
VSAPVKKEYHHQRSSNSMNEDSWRKTSNDEKENKEIVNEKNMEIKSIEPTTTTTNEKTNRSNYNVYGLKL